MERPNQAWCADITYLLMRKGFLYLVAIMDWFTPEVLACRISNTLEADFCVEALNEAIHKFGPPEITNTDQGSQFVSFAWTDRLKRVGTQISMVGMGRGLEGQPPAVVCLTATQTDQQVQAVAQETGNLFKTRGVAHTSRG